MGLSARSGMNGKQDAGNGPGGKAAGFSERCNDPCWLEDQRSGDGEKNPRPPPKMGGSPGLVRFPQGPPAANAVFPLRVVLA